MLRPIDVIFKHPVKKFTVIYQNGKLWQLPRLDFTGQSLIVKQPYKDSREHIFVASDQTLDPNDVPLMAELLTITLPEAIIGKNVNEFEAWWRGNWSVFQEEIVVKAQRRQHYKQLVKQAHLARVSPNALLQKELAMHTYPNSPSAQATSQVPQPQKIATPVPTALDPQAVTNQIDQSQTQPFKPQSGEHDIFDAMLDDLRNSL